MNELSCTLLTDGPADRALIPILEWILRQQVSLAVNITWADLRRLRRPPKDLPSRVGRAIELYPCDLLFVHRDAEGEAPERRREEIEAALADVEAWDRKRTVAVVPMRMTEAWLLIDETAMRSVAGNPRGSVPLAIPAVRRLEGLPDPKRTLHDLIRTASGLTGRQLRKFKMDMNQAVHRLAQAIQDYSPLRDLSAFRALEEEIEETLTERGWHL